MARTELTRTQLRERHECSADRVESGARWGAFHPQRILKPETVWFRNAQRRSPSSPYRRMNRRRSCREPIAPSAV